jgi:hypothetical protein
MQLVVEMRWVGLRTVATMSAINHYEKRFRPWSLAAPLKAISLDPLKKQRGNPY